MICCLCSFKTTVADWNGIENQGVGMEYQEEEKFLVVFLEEEFGNSAKTVFY